MRKHRTLLSLLGIAGLACLVMMQQDLTVTAEDAPKVDKEAKKADEPTPEEKEQQILSEFMRRKLDASSQILEGLSVEDYELISDGAMKLYKMSTVEKWRRSNDPLYRQFSSEFQRVTQDLIRAANEGSLDKSALKWMDVTMKCIECHRYVRETLVTGSDGDPNKS